MDTVYEINDLVLYNNEKGKVVKIINGITTTCIKIDLGIKLLPTRKTIIINICDKRLSIVEKNFFDDMLDTILTEVTHMYDSIPDIMCELNICQSCPKMNALESFLKALKEEICDINDNISYEKYLFYKDKMYVVAQELKNGGFKISDDPVHTSIISST
tara:strand:- start:889 stop:1365 length:477 start_codon:yes stop_codon:yes gene_type:complete